MVIKILEHMNVKRNIYIFETQTAHILLKTGKKCGLMQNLNLACESVIINRFVFKSYLSFDLSLNKVT